MGVADGQTVNIPLLRLYRDGGTQFDRLGVHMVERLSCKSGDVGKSAFPKLPRLVGVKRRAVGEDFGRSQLI